MLALPKICRSNLKIQLTLCTKKMRTGFVNLLRIAPGLCSAFLPALYSSAANSFLGYGQCLWMHDLVGVCHVVKELWCEDIKERSSFRLHWLVLALEYAVAVAYACVVDAKSHDQWRFAEPLWRAGPETWPEGRDGSFGIYNGVNGQTSNTQRTGEEDAER